MALDPARLLGALQHGDSFFPSGSIAFSWGLETLRHEGLMPDAAELERFVAGQLRFRWNCCDRAALAAAFARARDVAAVGEVDAVLEALSLAREAREGSRRVGAALLGVHERLGTPGAAAYRSLVRAGTAPGHLAVAQGLLWSGIGLALPEAEAVAAHGMAVALLGAAVRLGICGHVDAQRILRAQHPLIAALLAEPAVPMAAAGSAAFAADIAMMRHETGPVRLFAN
jgi:urease accessory protein